MKTYLKIKDIIYTLNEVTKITDVDYIDKEDKTLIETDSLISIIYDLTCEYHKLQDKFDDCKENIKENYVQKETTYADLGINERDFH